MNQRMRDLLAQIEAKHGAAKTYFGDGDTEKAKAALDEADGLQKEYEVAKRLFEAEKAKVPDEPAPAEKKADGFGVIAKLLRRQPLDETEKALVTGGTSGENNLMPEDVDLAIREMRKQYKSAKELVTVIPTDTMSGGFNFESGTPAGLADLTDGSDVDGSGEPSFVRKPFAIKLKGKLIAISNVLKGAEKAGLMAYINRWFVKNSVISENADIFAALKKDKTAKTIKGLMALKQSINKDLDPSALIGGVIVTNQTGFDLMEQELDANGRPMLVPNPQEPARRTFCGLPVEVFSDAQLPNVSGKAPVFYGALDAGCYFIEKSGLEFAVSDQYLFGKNQTAIRVIEGYDVIQADKDAYIYGTYEAKAAPAGG